MTPEYIQFDDRQREQFLSQLGTFSPGERELFRQLCRNWQEKIPYKRFAASTGIDRAGNAELISLMRKMRKEHLGLLRTEITNERRHPEAIVLSAKDGETFFRELMDEFFIDLKESITNSLPLESVISHEIGSIPSEVYFTVDLSSLSAFVDNEGESNPILRIPGYSDDFILLTAKNLRSAVTFAILKLRYYLGNTNLLGYLAKSMDLNLLEVKKRASGKDPKFWLELTGKINESQSEIAASRNFAVDRGFYNGSLLLNTIVEAQLLSVQNKKKEREERELDLKAVVLAVKENSGILMEQIELSRIIENQRDKYGDSFEQFREEFYERYVKAREPKSLPHVVMLNRKYIHRDNVFPTFLTSFRVLENVLQVHFREVMENQLKSGRRNKIFFSTDNFDEAIRSEVGKRDPLVHALMLNPGVLAEAIIHNARETNSAKSSAEIRRRLSIYFDPANLKPLPPHVWFDLNIATIFESAFEELHIFRRILIRITGKYDSFRSSFVGRGSAPSIPLPSTETTEREHRTERTRRDSTSGSHRSRSSSPREKKKAPQKQKVKKSYTQSDQDQAWESFGKTLKDK